MSKRSEKTRFEELAEKARSGFSFLSSEEGEELFIELAACVNDGRELQSKLSGDKLYEFLDFSTEELKHRGMSSPAAFYVTHFSDIASRVLECTQQDTLYSAAKHDPLKEDKNELEQFILNKFLGKYAESVLAIYFNSRGHISHFEFIADGTTDTSYIDSVKLCKNSLLASAKYVVLAHNHPSGFSTPSVQDCKTTRKLSNALDTIGVKLVDHFIVTRGKVTSMMSIYNFRSPDNRYHKLVYKNLESKIDSMEPRQY